MGNRDVRYQPDVPAEPGPPTMTVAAAEDLLAAWFDRPVVLLSSGRTGLRLLLQMFGLRRHDDSVRIPRFLSRCVINAITHQAIPVEADVGTAATLLYHQFGFPSRDVPDGRVVEDIAHAFFAASSRGSRAWLSDFAIFSLPKFFPTAGLCGGVITRTTDQAQAVRSLVAETATAADDTLAWMREVYRSEGDGATGPTAGATRWLDSVYELLYQFPRADAAALVGLPTSHGELADVGACRATHVATFTGLLGGWQPATLWDASDTVLPFALPYLGRAGRDGLLRTRRALLGEGFDVDIYHVDVHRSMAQPDHRHCLLLPCHQGVAPERFDAMCRVVAANDHDRR